VASNNKILVEIQTTDKGTTKIAVSELNKLDGAISRVSRSNRDAAKGAHQHYDAMNKGVIGTANGTKNFSKMASTLGGSNGLVAAYAGLAANIFAVTAAFNALRNAAQVEQVMRGLEASGNRVGRTLTNTARALKEVTNNAISMEDAMRSTAQVASAGFGSDAVVALGKAARDTSFALGRNMTDALDRITKGVVKLEPELLDELGIMTKLTESNTKMAASLGKSESQLTSFEKRQGFLNAVLEEATVKFGGLAEAAGDSTAYDNLAASFSDLTTQIFKTVNVISPAIQFLANNQLALLGVMGLFVSSIKGQLLPGLVNAAKASEEVALRFKEEAVQAKAAATAELARAQAIKSSAATNLANNLSLDIGSKKLQQMTTNLREGADATLLQDKYIGKLNQSIGGLKSQRSLAESLGDTAKVSFYDNKIAAVNKQIDTFKSLQKVQTEGATLEQSQLTAIEKARRDANIKTKEYAAQSKLSMAQQAAASGQLTIAFKSWTASINEYNIAQRLAAKGSLVSFATIKTAAYATATGIKLIGISILTWLPYLGLATIAFDALRAGITALKSDRVKELEKNLASLDEILSSYTNKMREVERINASNISSSLKQAQAYNIQTNSLLELSDALLKAAKAKEDLAKDPKSGIASFTDALFRGKDANTSYQLSIRQNSLAIRAFGSELDKAYSKGGLRFLPKDIEKSITALDALEQNTSPTVQAYVKLQGGIEAIGKAAIASGNPMEYLGKITGQAGQASFTTNQALQDLEKSLKEANLASGEFSRSFTPTTSFDKFNDSLTAVQNNLTILSDEFAKGNNLSDYTLQLANIGSNLSKYLDTSIARDLANFDKLSAERKKEVLQITEETFNSINNTVSAARAGMIVAKEQVSLAQAILSANDRLYSKTASGLAAKFKAEDNIRSLQVKQLEIEKSLQESGILRLKSKLEELKVQKGITAETINTQIAAARAEEAQAKISAIKAGLRDPDKPLAITSGAAVSGNKEVVAYNTYQLAKSQTKELEKQLANFRESQSIQKEIETTQRAISSLNSQISAIWASAPSNAQKLALISQRQVEITNEQRNSLKEVKSILDDNDNTQDSILSTIKGTNDSLNQQLIIITRTANQKRKALQDEYAIQRDILSGAQKVAQADLARATTKEDRQVAQDVLRLTKQQIDVLDYKLRAQQQSIDLEEQSAKVSKVVFDTRTKGLEIQQDSLSFVQKEIDATKELKNQLQTRYELDLKYRFKKSGIELSAEAQQALEIRAAANAYKLAVSESGIKKELIKLEFALLEAKRIQSIADLQVQKANLATIAGTERQVQQIDAVLSTLSKVDLTSAVSKQIQAIDAEIGNKLTELKTAAITTGTRAGGALAAFYSVQELVKAKKAAQEAIASATVKQVTKSLIDTNNAISKPIIDSNTVLVQSNQDLRASVEALDATLTKQLESTGIQSAANPLIAFGNYVKSLGLSPGEHEAFGGVNKKHGKNSRHYSNRAIDINAPKSGVVEANDPYYGPLFDKLERKAKELDLNVLWRVKDHYDHMHVSIANAIIESAAKADDKVTNDIVVTGKKQVPLYSGAQIDMPINDNSIGPVPIAKEITDPTGFKAVGESLGQVTNALQLANIAAQPLLETFSKLGPEGEIVLAINEGAMAMSQSFAVMFDTLGSASASSTEKFVSIASAASSALGTISSVLDANARAKVNNIEQEIAAEEKRDGKSAQSVAKIAALEKKKDAIQRKAFNTNKKIMMAQAIISTATGIATALSYGPIGIPLAVAIGAMGAAQLAIIAGTSYQSTAANTATVTTPSTLSIGKIGSNVDLAKQNTNAGGEIGYLRGAKGTGTTSSNFKVIGSAYGGELGRGYGNAGFLVGEKGPEVLTPDVPITVSPVNDNNRGSQVPIEANINIHAIDSRGMVQVLDEQRGNIISMIREAANSSGQSFLENVDVNAYTRPSVSKL